jgi:cystathionine beta-lyase family protein involved in aluminum resistance
MTARDELSGNRLAVAFVHLATVGLDIDAGHGAKFSDGTLAESSGLNSGEAPGGRQCHERVAAYGSFGGSISSSSTSKRRVLLGPILAPAPFSP